MDRNTREFLDGVYPYFKMLNDINIKFNQLVKHSIENEPYVNEELFYQISTDLVRVLPIKKMKTEEGRQNLEIDVSTGILLLKRYIPFLLDDYNKILSDAKCQEILVQISKIRNKYVHEPHNMKFSYMVGGSSSCSMGMYYKKNLWSISTIRMTNIICDLNLIFVKIQKMYVDKVADYGDKYIDYPCYKLISSYNFKQYNDEYIRLPWNYIDVLDETAESD